MCKVLIITCHKLDEDNGGANASKGFIHCLASLYDDCALIFPEFDDTDVFIPSNCTLYPCHDARPKLQKGLDMYRGVVSGLYVHVRKHLETHRYDIIVVDHSVTATSLVSYLKQTGTKLITIHHNVERDYLRDNGNERPITFRYPYNYFARKSERDCLLNSDVNLTLSQRDADVFASWYPSRNLHLHSIGIMEYRPIADKTFVPKPKGHTFAITGSLCYGQSLVSIVDFLRRYYAILQKACPDVRIIIAGRNPSPVLYEECKDMEGIEIIPNPEKIADIVRLADYYICPIFAGSGIKLRVLDALKQGLPVLCHSISSAGYEPFVDKGILFPYSDTASFEASLHRMLCLDISSNEIYQSFRQYFSVETGAWRLRQILQKEGIVI